ncbi:TetR/AcrR family transcriptional regulator [Hamadaea sp. NPDC050747]|uniref:TetR/AcrR family transcriptional regulator n=1 Tax=Hamadaea sp. NPDC050747 TaxID=3155789 RepID=UPI0033D7B1B6
MAGTDRSSAGDPARTLSLLWREAREPATGQRGPRPAQSVDKIVEAAITLADAEGLDVVSMRRVAQALAVAPMSLYTYVPGKAELIDLMLDTAYARMPRREPAGPDWRDRVAAVADDNRDLFERHPWLAAVSTNRPTLGPGAIAKYDYELRALDGLGLDDVELDAALTFVLGFVQTCARAAADVRTARQESAMNDEQWWAANQPLLAKMFDADRFPLASRVGAAAGAAHGSAYDPAHAYAFGLARVLDGLAVLIEQRPGT